jgi:hypothetical protein
MNAQLQTLGSQMFKFALLMSMLCVVALQATQAQPKLQGGTTVFGLIATDAGHYAIARGTLTDCWNAQECDSVVCRLFSNSTVVVDAVGLVPTDVGKICL